MILGCRCLQECQAEAAAAQQLRHHCRAPPKCLTAAAAAPIVARCLHTHVRMQPRTFQQSSQPHPPASCGVRCARQQAGPEGGLAMHSPHQQSITAHLRHRRHPLCRRLGFQCCWGPRRCGCAVATFIPATNAERSHGGVRLTAHFLRCQWRHSDRRERHSQQSCSGRCCAQRRRCWQRRRHWAQHAPRCLHVCWPRQRDVCREQTQRHVGHVACAGGARRRQRGSHMEVL
jgi:hypothetical protein